MAETRVPAVRPLSPHLQVYRLTLTMVMSGAHRVTGMFLYFGYGRHHSRVQASFRQGVPAATIEARR